MPSRSSKGLSLEHHFDFESEHAASARENVILCGRRVLSCRFRPRSTDRQFKTGAFDQTDAVFVFVVLGEEFDEDAPQSAIAKRLRCTLEHERLVTVDIDLQMRWTDTRFVDEAIEADAGASLLERRFEGVSLFINVSRERFLGSAPDAVTHVQLGD